MCVMFLIHKFINVISIHMLIVENISIDFSFWNILYSPKKPNKLLFDINLK